ncbi:MAG: hypothetical protein ABFE08_16245 [Armatimonadia bacterium]
MHERVTLTDRDSRARLMRQHVEAVARSIVEDHDGDEVFARYLSLTKHVHHYSSGNRMLIAWQAPDSRLVASRSAFDAVAKGQGHEGRQFSSRRGRRWTQHVTIAAGSRAIWVWGPTRRSRSVVTTDTETGEETREVIPFTGFIPVDLWAIEDVRYADDGEPMEPPDFVQPIEDEALYHSLLAFAEDKDIEVCERGLNGARGVSMVGRIGLQAGDHWSLRIGPLIHELGHELMHDVHARLTEPNYLHEHEAEAVATVVLGYLGHPTAISASYLRNWGASPRNVVASMDRIASCAGEIVEFIERRTEVSVEVARATSLAVA